MVTLYTQPGCGPCVGVKAALKSRGVPYTEKNIREDEAAAERLIELGYRGTPVVEHPGGHFSGLNIAEVDKLAVALF